MTTSVAAEKDTSCRTRHRGATAERTRAVVGTEGMRSGTLNRAPAYGRRLMLSLTATAAAIGAAGRVAAQTPARQTVGTERSTTNMATTKHHCGRLDRLLSRGRAACRRRPCCSCTGFRRLRACTEPLLFRLCRAGSASSRRTTRGSATATRPAAAGFAYTFDHLAEIMEHFCRTHSAFGQLFALSPGLRRARSASGWRWPIPSELAIDSSSRTPWRTMNGPEAALGEAAGVLGRSTPHTKRHCAKTYLSLAATRQRHVGRSPNVENFDPDLWSDEFAFLGRPGQADIQSDLFYDYRTDVAQLPGVAGVAAPASSGNAAGSLGAHGTPPSGSREPKPMAGRADGGGASFGRGAFRAMGRRRTRSLGCARVPGPGVKDWANRRCGEMRFHPKSF